MKTVGVVMFLVHGWYMYRYSCMENVEPGADTDEPCLRGLLTNPLADTKSSAKHLAAPPRIVNICSKKCYRDAYCRGASGKQRDAWGLGTDLIQIFVGAGG